jgi:hypothetical protein
MANILPRFLSAYSAYSAVNSIPVVNPVAKAAVAQKSVAWTYTWGKVNSGEKTQKTHNHKFFCAFCAFLRPLNCVQSCGLLCKMRFPADSSRCPFIRTV